MKYQISWPFPLPFRAYLRRINRWLRCASYDKEIIALLHSLGGGASVLQIG